MPNIEKYLFVCGLTDCLAVSRGSLERQLENCDTAEEGERSISPCVSSGWRHKGEPVPDGNAEGSGEGHVRATADKKSIGSGAIKIYERYNRVSGDQPLHRSKITCPFKLYDLPLFSLPHGYQPQNTHPALPG